MLSRKLVHLLASCSLTAHHLTVFSGTARHSPGGQRGHGDQGSTPEVPAWPCPFCAILWVILTHEQHGARGSEEDTLTASHCVPSRSPW